MLTQFDPAPYQVDDHEYHGYYGHEAEDNLGSVLESHLIGGML
jgi:hypothetical protein